jgi:hypothetical protein
MARYLRMLLFFAVVTGGPALVGYLLVPGSGLDDFDDLAEFEPSFGARVAAALLAAVPGR